MSCLRYFEVTGPWAGTARKVGRAKRVGRHVKRPIGPCLGQRPGTKHRAARPVGPCRPVQYQAGLARWPSIDGAAPPSLSPSLPRLPKPQRCEGDYSGTKRLVRREGNRGAQGGRRGAIVAYGAKERCHGVAQGSSGGTGEQ